MITLSSLFLFILVALIPACITVLAIKERNGKEVLGWGTRTALGVGALYTLGILQNIHWGLLLTSVAAGIGLIIIALKNTE